MARNGWHPVQGLGGGAWIIERYLPRVLTPVEHKAECAAYFEQIAQLGPIEIDGSLQEDDGVLPPELAMTVPKRTPPKKTQTQPPLPAREVEGMSTDGR